MQNGTKVKSARTLVIVAIIGLVSIAGIWYLFMRTNSSKTYKQQIETVEEVLRSNQTAEGINDHLDKLSIEHSPLDPKARMMLIIVRGTRASGIIKNHQWQVKFDESGRVSNVTERDIFTGP